MSSLVNGRNLRVSIYAPRTALKHTLYKPVGDKPIRFGVGTVCGVLPLNCVECLALLLGSREVSYKEVSYKCPEVNLPEPEGSYEFMT